MVDSPVIAGEHLPQEPRVFHKAPSRRAGRTRNGVAEGDRHVRAHRAIWFDERAAARGPLRCPYTGGQKRDELAWPGEIADNWRLEGETDAAACSHYPRPSSHGREAVYPRNAGDRRDHRRDGRERANQRGDPREYPYLETEDVAEALSYAAWRAEEVEVPLGQQ